MADRKTRFTQAIWQITQQLRDYKVLDNALSACLETIITTLDSEAGTIWLLDKSSNRLFPVFNHGPVDISGITIENGQGIAGSVVQSGESVITSSVGDDPRFTRSVDEESGTRKSSPQTMYVNASDINNAANILTDRMADSNTDWEIKSIAETKVLAVLNYKA